MLASITPLGERGRGRRWSRTVTAFFIGAVAGGGALGAVVAVAAWLASAAPTGARWDAVVVAAVSLLLLDRAGRLPSWRRQVDVRWLADYRGWVVGVGYGAQLGAAVVTIVAAPSTWVLLLVAVGSGSPAVAMALCVAFAVARAMPLLAVARVTSPEALRGLHRRMASLGTPAALVDRAVTWTVAGGLVIVAAVA